MILRRIITHFRKQEWTAIAIDFLIVVLGVFIGIQFANLNAARSDRERGDEYVVRLTRDFNSIIVRSEAALERWQSVLTAAERLIADVEAYRADGELSRPFDEFRRDFDRVISGRIPAPQAATFVEMLSAGDIGLIRSTDSRDALLAYDEQAHYALEAYRVLVNRTQDSINALAAFSDIRIPPPHGVYDSDDDIITASVDIEKLAADPAALTALKILAVAADNHRGLTIAHLERARAALDALESGE